MASAGTGEHSDVGPEDIPAPGWRAVLRRTVKEFRNDNLTDWAAALTYYGVLALFPALIALVSIVGLLGQSTINGLKSGYVSATLDQLLYLQGFMPVLQCVLTAKYKMPGLNLNTGAGAVTAQTITDLIPLIEAGIR